MSRCWAGPARASPQFISSSDGSWLGTSACIERITADVIDAFADVRKELADFNAALAIFLELVRRLESRAGFAFGAQIFHGQKFARIFSQSRLGIERINVGRAAIGKNVNDPLGFAIKVGPLRHERGAGSNIGLGAGGARSQAPEKSGQSEGAHAHATALKELSAVPGQMVERRLVVFHNNLL